MSSLVFLESAPENYVPALALDCHDLLPSDGGGWLRPRATAVALGNFLDAWRRNDPNGVWGWVTEVDDCLICTQSDTDEADEFPLAGHTNTGEALYDLTGWPWVAADGETAL